MSPDRKHKGSPWLELLRVPNLLTVAGDPIAGYLLAAKGQEIVPVTLLGVIAACLLFYAAGLLMNDYVDVAEDRQDRPDRPIPSGRVARGSVLAVIIVLFAGALAFSFLLGPMVRQVGLALFLSILVYNFGGKGIPLFGPFNMGICRGFSLLLGAAAAPGGEWMAPSPTLAFDVLVLYVAAVSYIAQKETSHKKIGAERWLPAFVLAASFAVLSRMHPMTSAPLLLVFCGGFIFSGIIALVVANTLELVADHAAKEDDPEEKLALRTAVVPQLVSMLLGSILMLQASLVGVSNAGDPAIVAGVTLLALWPIHRILSRRFYAS